MDIIDQYLMDGLLDLPQHRAGEYLIGQANRAGAWPSTANMSGTQVTGGEKDWTPKSSFGFLRTVKGIEKHYGWFHSWLVVEVVIRDWDVSESPMRMVCLKQALDWIVERRTGPVSDPLKRLQIVAKKKG